MNELFVIVCVPAAVALMAVLYVLALSGFQEINTAVQPRTRTASHASEAGTGKQNL